MRNKILRPSIHSNFVPTNLLMPNRTKFTQFAAVSNIICQILRGGKKKQKEKSHARTFFGGEGMCRVCFSWLFPNILIVMNIVLVFYMHNMKAEIVMNLLLGQLSSTFKSGKEPHDWNSRENKRWYWLDCKPTHLLTKWFSHLLIKLKEGSPCDMNAEVFSPISCQASSRVTHWNNEAQNENGKFHVNIHTSYSSNGNHNHTNIRNK